MSYHNQAMEDAGFEKQERLMSMLQRENLTIVDVGGHIGESIEKYRSLFPACSVYSFEPHPESFNSLEQRYGQEEGVRCERLALGSKLGSATFYAMRCSSVSSLLPPEDLLIERSANRNYDYSKMEVPMDTLDRVAARLSLTGIDILKMDVQGSELEVLRGASGLLRESRIDLIFSEVLFAEMYVGQSDCNEIWNYLKKFGYVLWDLFPFVHTTMGRLWTANAIFLSAATAAQIDLRHPAVTLRPAGQSDNAAENLSDYA